MKRVINIDGEYRCTARKAIEKFFKKYPEYAEAWKELFQNMNEYNVEHEIDNMDNMGNLIPWSFSAWLIKDEKYTYIALITRE